MTPPSLCPHCRKTEPASSAGGPARGARGRPFLADKAGTPQAGGATTFGSRRSRRRQPLNTPEGATHPCRSRRAEHLPNHAKARRAPHHTYTRNYNNHDSPLELVAGLSAELLLSPWTRASDQLLFSDLLLQPAVGLQQNLRIESLDFSRRSLQKKLS